MTLFHHFFLTFLCFLSFLCMLNVLKDGNNVPKNEGFLNENMLSVPKNEGFLNENMLLYIYGFA